MNLSTDTISVLKNFSEINQNLLVNRKNNMKVYLTGSEAEILKLFFDPLDNCR